VSHLNLTYVLWAVTPSGAPDRQRRNGLWPTVAAQSEQDKSVLREQLRTQLNVILEPRETAAA
jgi:hypothetical protein